MKILCADCCIRGGDSATRRLMERYVETAYPGNDIEYVRLAGLGLKPLLAEDIAKRDALLKARAYDDPMLSLARQFRDADCIVVAAPYWDLSFPSLLKVYLEHITVSGITFGYVNGVPTGFCRAKKLTYLSTCGGPIFGAHLGFEYVKALGNMLGIRDFEEHHIENLDIDLEKRNALVEEGIAQILKTI